MSTCVIKPHDDVIDGTVFTIPVPTSGKCIRQLFLLGKIHHLYDNKYRIKLQSERSNTDKPTELSETSTPLFKAIVNNHGKITALQRTELLNGKPQDPMVVLQHIRKERYSPGKLPIDFKNGTLWKTLRNLLEDTLPLKAVEVPHTATLYWVWDGDEEMTNQKTLLLKMVQKYGNRIPTHFCEPVVNIMRAFLHSPPFSNNVGRQAVYSLLYLCRELVRLQDVEKWSESGICNAGGGALGYEGRCTFVKFTAPAECEDVAKYLAKKCQVINNKGKLCQVNVPDGQVFSLSENDISKSYSKFYLTIEVKSIKKQEIDHDQKHKRKKSEKKRNQELKSEVDEATHTWMQALVGLAKSDTSYGILINPSYARIYELGIHDPTTSRQGMYKCLLTSTKTFNFVHTAVHESVMDLIEAIVCIMML